MWFSYRKTKTDNDIEKEWHYNLGKNVKFYDEITGQEYEPEEEIPLPIPIIIGEQDEGLDILVESSKIQVRKKGNKKRYYLPRKQITQKVRQHLIALKGFACENCHENSFSHIHHQDGNPSNNSLDNLRLVCIKCHKLIHAEMRKNED